MMGLFEFVSGVLNSFIELISVGWITRNQYNRFPIFNLKKILPRVGRIITRKGNWKICMATSTDTTAPLKNIGLSLLI